MPHALAYASEATCHFGEDELSQLSRLAAHENAKADVTGYFFFKDNLFFQYLEGDVEKVKDLMDKISNDPRHSVSRQIVFGNIPNRLFADWQMRYISASAMVGVGAEIIFHNMLLNITDARHPEQLVVSQTMSLIHELAAYQKMLNSTS